MVDSTEAMESSFLTVQIVKDSTTKKLVVLDQGSYETTENNERRLSIVVNIDGKKKKWRPNKETVQNLQVLGKDTVNWVGKVINLQIQMRGGKEAVIGTATAEPKTSVEVIEE